MSKTLSQKDRSLKKKQSILPVWKSKLCNCFEDDCGLCCLGFFCFNTSLPQMYERIIIRGYCFFITILLWVCFGLFFVPASIMQPYVGTSTEMNTTTVIKMLTGITSFIIFTTVSVKMIISIRTRLRIRDNIDGNECDDCCTSLWCSCCSHIQHMKQEGISSSNYNLTSTTAI